MKITEIDRPNSSLCVTATVSQVPSVPSRRT